MYFGFRQLITIFIRRIPSNNSNHYSRKFSLNMAEQINDNQRYTGSRLPGLLKPIHYDLTLKPNLEQFTFEGSVKIEYKAGVDVSAKEIVLNASELKITEGHIDPIDNSSSKCSLTKVIYSEKSETATLEFNGTIPKAGYMSLQFSGILNDKLKGFYRTAIKMDDVVIHAATTQFEAVGARRCFPCWDEPAIRATFSTTLVYDKSIKFQGKTKAHEYPLVALSNMPVVEEQTEPGTGKRITKYDKTPSMSTYLLAFIVGPFESLDGTDGKRPVRIFTTLGKKEQGKFALDVACRSLQFFEEYFKIDYPLKKMDLIAIPDFAMGAMENWGLLTFRETLLTVDPENTSTHVKELVAIVIAHEIAHQWFGNLVTINWWTHLWLKEGFATFMEYLCVDHVFPEYEIWSQFVADSYLTALDLDSMHSSHPIEVPIEHPSDIDEIFDNISYNKGSSIIRMLHNYIGEDNFRTGLSEYLTKFAYKSATTEDLWDSLGQASGKPVREVMSHWTSKKGFPWLSVESSNASDGSVKLSLSQNKFTADGKLSPDDLNQLWPTPISVVTSQDPSKSQYLGLLGGKSDVMLVNGLTSNQEGSWFKLNPGCIGFYHTAYPEAIASKLLPAILNKNLQPLDRLGLQNEYYSLCQAGKVKTVDLLKLIQAYKAEDYYTVWKSIDGCCGHLNLLLSYTDFQPSFHAFGRTLYAQIFDQVTWIPEVNEKHTGPLMRALVINRLISFGDQRVIEEAKQKYKAHCEGLETIPADLRSVVYGAIASYGDDAQYDSLFELYRKAELHEEKVRIGASLGRTKNLQRLERVIKFALSEEVRNQDMVSVIMPISANNPLLAWKFFKDNKDVIREKFESNPILQRMIKCCTGNLASEEMAQEVSKFFADNKFIGCQMNIQQSIESIRLNANWLARDRDSIKDFLATQ